MKMTSRRSRRRPNRKQAEKKDQQPFFNQTQDSTIQTKGEDAFFQPKLSIGQPGDKYEKEADAMADAVVNRTNNSPAVQQQKADQIQRVTLASPEKDERLGTAEQRMEEDKMIQEKPEEELQMMGEEEEPLQMMTDEEEPIQKMEEEEPVQMMHEEEEVQAKSESSTTSTASQQLSTKVQQRKGRGKPLPENTRSEMENAFGADFSTVNIHTDTDAVQLNKELGAQAFTNGKDVYFNTGKYRPETNAGKHLLAHELTHVVQQGGEKIQPKGKNEGGNRIIQAKCESSIPKDCFSYGAWLETIPKSLKVGDTDKIINNDVPADLKDLITGKLSAAGGLTDCADVAYILRHYYLNAKGESFSFKVGRTRATANEYKLGKDTKDTEITACLRNAGTTSFQETRKDFALVNFYKNGGTNTTNLKKLIDAGLKPGDLFVWKRLAGITGNFQGHVQTIQSISQPQFDHKKALTKEGHIVVVQGNMSAGKGVGELQQRIYSFKQLTGKDDGNAPILPLTEESFFGAGPWKS